MKDQPILYHRKSGIIFKWVEEINSYEPIYHNVKINENGEFIGDEIKKGTIFYDFITFIRYSSMITDKRTGKKAYGKFEIYQWAIAFNVIKLCMALKSDKCLTSISRQAKLYWSV